MHEPSRFTLRAKLTLLCLVPLAAAAVAHTALPAGGEPEGSPGPLPAYTMISVQTVTPPGGGAARLVSTHVRRQRRDGLFCVVTTYHEGGGAQAGIVTTFGAEGGGSFVLDEGQGRLVFRGPVPEAARADAATLRSDPRYSREEAVAGVQTVVLREVDAEGGGFTETFRAPSLGGLLLKSVRESARGREVFETTSLERQEPDGAAFEAWRHPADYSHYRVLIERERGRGRAREAVRMADEMERVRRFKP